MLRKFIAKLREKISPSRSEKKTTKVDESGKSHRRQGHSDRSKDRGERRHESGHSARSAGGGAAQGHRTGGGGGRRSDRGREDGTSRRRHDTRREVGHSREPEYDHGPSIVEAPVVPPEVPKMTTAFSALGLADSLAFAVQQKGYSEPTPIQTQAIPVVLSGRDVMGSAQTGTGKTAAFALPIIQRLGHRGRLRCLVLEPTRELALQVENAFIEYSKYSVLRTSVVYGGVGYGKQTEALRRGVDILVATPGRLLDHLEQRNTTLADVEILVLDEVDRMLDMGFLPDVKRIVEKCPRARQTLFFSATLPPEIERLSSWAVRDPVRIEVGQRRSPAETVAHAFYPVVEAQKFDLLLAMLDRTNYESVIVFCRTKVGADRVAAWLKGHEHSVGVMHSDRNMQERIEALEGFKSGRFAVLVATDIAARGLDIAGVTHVINYDVPENPEDYVHRIGRTGRAQKTGDAFTIVGEEDVRHARSIERFINAPIERKRLSEFAYTYSALFDSDALSAATKPSGRLAGRMRR